MKVVSFMISAFIVITLAVYCVMLTGGEKFVRYNLAFAGSTPIIRSEAVPAISPPPETTAVPVEQVPPPMPLPAPAAAASGDHKVQAVLSAKRRAVISSTIDAQILKFKFNNGDIFKKGDVLVEYDCAIDRARLKEAESRQRATQVQLEAYEKLHTLESVSDVEYLVAKENHEQNNSLVDQIKGRLRSCRIVAPFDGRVTNKMASQFEFAQTGRVLMDIASREPLRAEFLIPSRWLQWLNISTPLRIYINETGRHYAATIVAVHGEVDPVSQSVQVVAEMETYHEELLPGMSGQAMFAAETTRSGANRGFLGLVLGADAAGAHDKN